MLVSSLMAEWSKAPSVEPLVVTGSDPALANDYLFAVYSSLYDHSAYMFLLNYLLGAVHKLRRRTGGPKYQ